MTLAFLCLLVTCKYSCFSNSRKKKVRVFTFRSTLQRWKIGSILPLQKKKKGQKCGLQDFWSNIVTMSQPATSSTNSHSHNTHKNTLLNNAFKIRAMPSLLSNGGTSRSETLNGKISFGRNIAKE